MKLPGRVLEAMNDAGLLQGKVDRYLCDYWLQPLSLGEPSLFLEVYFKHDSAERYIDVAEGQKFTTFKCLACVAATPCT